MNFIDIMTTLRKNKVAVTYIDHHDIDPTVVKSLEENQSQSNS